MFFKSKHEFVGSIILSMVAMAFADFGGGPMQTEFTSYEPADAVDMVNLPSGNFVYTLPLGDVKTPSGVGYPLAMHYHAGIRNNEDASWVGLGWSLNVGSINRMVMGCPDDYNGENTYSYIHNIGQTGYDNYFGFDFTVCGIGWGLTFGWRHVAGSGSVENLGVTSSRVHYLIGTTTYTGDEEEVSMLGAVSINGDGDYTINTPILSYSGNYGKRDVLTGTIAGFSISTEGSVGYSMGFKSTESMGNGWSGGGGVGIGGKNMITENGIKSWSKGWGSGGYGSFKYLTLGFSFSHVRWGWSYEKMESGRAFGSLYQSPYSPSEVITNNELLVNAMNESEDPWKYYTVEEGGSGAEPQLKERFEDDRMEFYEGENYHLPENDLYIVNGQGIGGVFKTFTWRPAGYFAGAKHGIFGKMVGGEWESYLNPDHRKISPDFREGFVFKMIGEGSLNCIDQPEGFSYTGMNSFLNIDDAGYQTSGTRIDPIFGHIEEFSDKICGFVITKEDGTRYWYLVPLFSLQNSQYSNTVRETPRNMTKENVSYSENFGVHAPTWLLSAITGPDYVKNNFFEANGDDPLVSPTEKMMPHDGDYGFWVAFNYEYGFPVKENEKGIPELKTDEQKMNKITYPWRDPYYNNFTEAFHITNPCMEDGDPMSYKYTSSFGLKEMTYLKAIETASEVAYFRLSERLDGMGVNYQTDEYPKFMDRYPLTMANVGGVIVGDNYEKGTITSGCDRSSVLIPPTVAPLPENISKLDDCLVVTVDDPAYGINFYEAAQAGDKIMELNFLATKKYKSICKRKNLDPPKKNQKATMFIVKDMDGWSVDDDGNVTIENTSRYKPQVEEIRVSGHHISRSAAGTFFISVLTLGLVDDPNIKVTKVTPYARCFHVEQFVDPNDGRTKWRYYIAAYQDDVDGDGDFDGIRTGFSFKGERNRFTYRYRIWELWSYDDVRFDDGNPGFIRTNARGYYLDRNVISHYVKKLDEVAWYSKAEYPYIDRFTDPGDPGVKQNEPWENLNYPESYRRVKFRYNYELAKNSPNSKAGEISYDGDGNVTGFSGGRLTLKEVRDEVGPEDASLSMPPYLFSYQGKDVQYERFNNVDAWGMRVEDPENIDFTDNMRGVNWNLQKIVMPSCATMVIEYERDELQGPLATLHKIKQRNSNCFEQLQGLEYENPSDEYFIVKEVINVDDVRRGANIVLENVDQLEAGMYFYLALYDQNDDIIQTNYSYQIKDVKAGDEIEADLDVSLPLSVASVYLKAIKNGNIYCDGIRTKSIAVNSMENSKKIIYSYDNGNVEMIPDAQMRDLFNTPKAGINLLPYIRLEAEYSVDIENMTGTTYDFNYPNEPDIRAVLVPTQDHASVSIKYNSTQPFYDVLFRLEGRRLVNEDYIGTIWVNGYGPDVWGGEKNTGNMFEGATPEGVFFYASLLQGENTITIQLNDGDDENALYIIDCLELGNVNNAPKSLIVSDRFNANPTVRYNTGNTSVIYSFVDVVSSDITNTANNGKTRFSFYNWNDVLTGYNEFITTEDIEESSIKIRKVVDRSGIIGSLKKVEIYNDGDQLVQEREVNYTYSDQLSDANINHEKPGVLFNSLSDRVHSGRSLGTIRQRTKKYADYDYSLKSVMDITTHASFLTGITTKSRGVIKTSKLGLFDALTAQPLATINQNSEYPEKEMISLNIPLLYKMKAEGNGAFDCLMENHIYNRSAATMIIDKSKLNSAYLNLDGIPQHITSVIEEHNNSANFDVIVGANMSTYSFENIPVNGQNDIVRINPDKEYAWKGSTFSLDHENSAIWQRVSSIGKVDYNSHALTQNDADGNPFTTIPHHSYPFSIGSVAGANYDECGVLPGDCGYVKIIQSEEDNENIPVKDWIDPVNGWEAGNANAALTDDAISEVREMNGPFGNKAIHVENAYGPGKNFKAYSGKKYILSAWVKVNSGGNDALLFVAEHRKASNPGAQMEWPIPLAALTSPQEDPTFISVSESDHEWQFVEMEIPAFTADGWYLRVWIGNGSAAVNADICDIRFYPEDALVTTNYFNYKNGTLIATVDENNHATFINYDAAGRPVETGIVKVTN